MDPDQTAPIGAVCSVSMLFTSKLKSSVMLGNYLQQTTSADVIFQMHFFLALYGLKSQHKLRSYPLLLKLINTYLVIFQGFASAKNEHFSLDTKIK